MIFSPFSQKIAKLKSLDEPSPFCSSCSKWKATKEHGNSATRIPLRDGSRKSASRGSRGRGRLWVCLKITICSTISWLWQFAKKPITYTYYSALCWVPEYMERRLQSPEVIKSPAAAHSSIITFTTHTRRHHISTSLPRTRVSTMTTVRSV